MGHDETEKLHAKNDGHGSLADEVGDDEFDDSKEIDSTGDEYGYSMYDGLDESDWSDENTSVSQPSSKETRPSKGVRRIPGAVERVIGLGPLAKTLGSDTYACSSC
ncbi:MAG: hypothetical protein O3B86_12865, partial [Planctomycetota bacterium]|nr:hypothetical protein [Planctomycetota bacterium]